MISPNASGDNHERHLPYWWNHSLPHPGWCTVDHRDRDFGSDRDCLGASLRYIYPSLPDAAHNPKKKPGKFRTNSVETLFVDIVQTYRECEPRVAITSEYTYEGTQYWLTRDETERLAHALIEATCLIDGQQESR